MGQSVGYHAYKISLIERSITLRYSEISCNKVFWCLAAQPDRFLRSSVPLHSHLGNTALQRSERIAEPTKPTGPFCLLLLLLLLHLLLEIK